MKTPILVTLFAVAAQFATGMNQAPQNDTTKHISADTSARRSSIYYGPTFGTTPIDKLGYHAATVDNPKVLQLSSGLSVLNALRGQAPNVSLSPNAPDATISLRTGTPLYVIDGIPFNNINSHYNLNAFEYQRISVINSGNAAVRYAGAGLNSMVLLQRKTGANISRPMFEAMSYTTLGSNDAPHILSTEGKHIDQWMFTNGLAYAQDFGAVDTRVSYSYSFYPSADEGFTKTNVHATSINTGLELGDRFRARLILDQFTRLTGAESTTQFINNIIANDYSGDETFLQGNLALSYELTDWLKISSQGSISRIKDEFEQSYQQPTLPMESYSTSYEHQQRSLWNVFLNGSKALGENFTLNFAAGHQVEKYNPYTSNYMVSYMAGDVYSEMGNWSGYEIETGSWLGELGFNYRDYLSLTANYQHNNFNEEENDTYAFATAFTFSDAFHWKSNGFSMGRIRLNYGKADVRNKTLFPLSFDDGYFGSSGVNSLGVEGSNFEGGIDLGFANNRFTLSITRFHNIDENTYMWVYAPWIGTPVRYLRDVGKFTNKGWEMALNTRIVSNDNIAWSATLNWASYKTELDGLEWVAGNDTDGQYQWRAGLLNQVDFKNWFASVLIDTFQDDTYVDVDYNGDYIWSEVSQVKLRDLSVGYSFSRGDDKFLKGLRLSFSARNLWTIHSTAERDPEATFGNYSTLKTFSLGVSATF